MRSKKVEFRLPWEVHDLIEGRARDLGFITLGRLMTATAFYEAFHDRRMSWLRDMAHCKPKLQDFLYHELIVTDVDLDDLIAIAQMLHERRKRKRDAASSPARAGAPLSARRTHARRAR